MKPFEQEMDFILDKYLNGLITKEEVQELHEKLQRGESIYETEAPATDVQEMDLPESRDLTDKSPYYERNLPIYEQQQDFENTVETPKAYLFTKKYASGAVFFFFVVLFAPIIYFILSMEHSNSLVAKYFEPHTITIQSRDLVRADVQDEWENAVEKYVSRQYAGTIASLNRVKNKQPDDAYIDDFYIGVSYIACGQAREAIEHLNDAKDAAPTDWHDEIDWYRALAHVQESEREKAQKLLNDLTADTQNYNYQKTKKLLEEISQ